MAQTQKNLTFFSDMSNISTLFKLLILTGLFCSMTYILLTTLYNDEPYHYFAQLTQKGLGSFYNIHDYTTSTDSDPTNISHIVIGIAGGVKPWKSRKSLVEAWWQPNVTKGYLFLDEEPTEFLPWSILSPPYRVSENISRFKPYDEHGMKDAIRNVRVIIETFREANDERARWFVQVDDDTTLFWENLVEVLSSYDHRKYFYIGANSESVLSNFDHSFEMAFGGSGCAISYPLAEALSKNLDVCIKRYPSLYGSDHMLKSCVADLGVSLTHEKGFHQIDLHKDLSGFLSAHPHSPLLTLHHLHTVEPIFPSMNRSEALIHLMNAAKTDQSRLLQQTICYQKSKQWSVSIAWGYSAQVYEKIIPPSILEKPLETFSAWRTTSGQPFMFNTRKLSDDPCDMPHVFFLESVKKITEKNQIVTSYTRRSPRTLPPCPLSNGNSSALIRDITKIIVISPANKYSALGGTRRECCDVLDQVEENLTTIKYRACMKNELVLGADIEV